MLRMGRRHPVGLLLYPGMVPLHKGTMVEAGSILLMSQRSWDRRFQDLYSQVEVVSGPPHLPRPVDC